MWLTARGDIVRRACRENSFSKAARRSVKIPADLPDRLAGLFEQRCLDLIGLARRSGHAVAGFEKVRAAAAGGKVALLLEASDGASDGREKIARAAPGSVTLSLWSAEQLGRSAATAWCMPRFSKAVLPTACFGTRGDLKDCGATAPIPASNLCCRKADGI